jgi:hypothetical protein
VMMPLFMGTKPDILLLFIIMGILLLLPLIMLLCGGRGLVAGSWLRLTDCLIWGGWVRPRPPACCCCCCLACASSCSRKSLKEKNGLKTSK